MTLEGHISPQAAPIREGIDVPRGLRRVHIEDMTPHFQETLLRDLEAKYVLRGELRPKKKARDKIKWLNKRPQTHRAWRRVRFFTLQSIDRSRMKLGLSPINFP